MKGYICAILLICGGMACSASHTLKGVCLFGGDEVSVGKHTTTPCMGLICETNGEVTMASCPLTACNPGQRVVGMTPERPEKSFPDCCAQPICKSRHYFEVAGLPYPSPLIGFE